MSSLIFFILFILLQNFFVHAEEKEGVFEKIKSGLQYAKNYLDTAKEIADLVSKSLGHRNNNDNNNNNNNNNNNMKNKNSNKSTKNKNEKRGDDGGKNDVFPKGPEVPQLLSGFFRLLGLDSSRIAAIAVNSVIFLAQMISSLFNIKPEIEEPRGRDDSPLFDPLRFITENKNEKVQNLLQQAEDPKLPDQLIDKIDPFNSPCVKLLICKSSPIIHAAQNSLRNKTIVRRFDMTSWLPKMEEFEENADKCEERHIDCILFPD